MFYIILLTAFVFGCSNQDILAHAIEVPCECDASNACDAGTQETDSITETQLDSDTGFHDPVCNMKTMDYDTETYYYDGYSVGPYGFKEMICPHVDAGYLTRDGDTIHNICLPSDDGYTYCLSDFRTKGILFVHVVTSDFFSILTGGSINSSPQIIKDKCGLNSEFVTILISGTSTEPTFEDAKKWKASSGAKDHILYDKGNKWRQRLLKDSWPSAYPRNPPFVFAVNKQDMKIWDTFIGWDYRYNFYSDTWHEAVCSNLQPIAGIYENLMGYSYEQ